MVLSAFTASWYGCLDHPSSGHRRGRRGGVPSVDVREVASHNDHMIQHLTTGLGRFNVPWRCGCERSGC
ncbi:hypothetical protein STRAU_4395 [Streptomyces aurantiacus JA 4570]|uniref:Uncharacterized protein n=1 Tax=Streptomyces aurantiacus JA 4570 TaxID=1286094 RepID=S3ZIP6_9ACTN|nr:hypothetical protein STRAU_4395 [Streptomyces aurantiacus JA 4570]